MQNPVPVAAATTCAIALIVIATLVPPARAWGPQGHRVAGLIAEQHLTPDARQAVRAILGNESLATASTWADRMRSDPAPFWQRTAGAYHYVNVAAGRGYRPGDAPRSGDAYSALAGFARDLGDDSSSAKQRQLALRFAIHIVQDLHQPLHAGERDDRGGNDFQVRFEGRQDNLHRVWDSGLLGAAGRSDHAWVRHLDRTFPEAERSTWPEADPLTWIRESAELSRDIYPVSAVIDRDYVEQHRATVGRRLAQAGVRTAAYLNQLFSEGPVVPPARSPWQRLKELLEEIVE